MNRHTISISATNVYDREDPTAPRLGYRVSCSCGMRWRNVWRDRLQATAFGNTHLGYVRGLYAAQSVPGAESAPKTAGVVSEATTTETGGCL